MTKEKCEVCGKEADILVNDFFVWGDHDCGWMESAIAAKHAFCHEHKRESIEIDVSLSESAWEKMQGLGLDPAKYLQYYRSDEWYGKIDIGIYTIAYNGYGKFLPQWCEAISNLTVMPEQVVIGLFGEDHGLSHEDRIKCYNLLKGIDFKIANLGDHVNIGTDRNRAVALLNTKWVMLVSADDVILPDAISILAKRDKPSADVIICPYIERLLDGNERVIEAPKSLDKNSLLNWHSSWLSPYSVFRRSFWEEHPYENIEYPNIPFAFSFAAYGARFAVADKPCAIYIKRSDSHYGRRDAAEQAKIAKSLDEYQEAYREIAGV